MAFDGHHGFGEAAGDDVDAIAILDFPSAATEKHEKLMSLRQEPQPNHLRFEKLLFQSRRP